MITGGHTITIITWLITHLCNPIGFIPTFKWGIMKFFRIRGCMADLNI